MTPLEILKAARQTLTPPEAWTKGHFAEDANGTVVEPYSDEAVCWCVLGAIRKHSYRDYPANVELAKTLFDIRGTYCIPTFNDAGITTHADVLHAFDMTIVRLESESQYRLQAKEK